MPRLTKKQQQQKENLREFVAALRGKYRFKQLSGTLSAIKRWNERTEKAYARPIRKYCCLGVACEVAIAQGLELTVFDSSAEVPSDLQDAYSGRVYDSNSSTLPISVVEHFGFDVGDALEKMWKSYDPKLTLPPELEAKVRSTGGYEQKTTTATCANDTLKFDFLEIADLFEYTYLRKDYDERKKTQTK